MLYLFGFALFTLESLISIWVLEVIAYFFIYFILFLFSCLLQFIFMNSSDLAKMKHEFYKFLTQLLHQISFCCIIIFFVCMSIALRIYHAVSLSNLLQLYTKLVVPWSWSLSLFCNSFCRECTCISEGIGEEWQWDNEVIQKSSLSESNIRVTGCKAESSRLENNEFAMPGYFF